MISIDCNIFLFLFLAHFLDILIEYQKNLSEFKFFHAIELKENPNFYTPSNLLKGLELHLPAIISIFKKSKHKINELEAKNIMMEGIINSENFISLRLNVNNPIYYDIISRNKDMKKYDGELNFHLNDRNSPVYCILENSSRKHIKICEDAFMQIKNHKNTASLKNPSNFQKIIFMTKSFVLDFFTFRHFTIGYEESELILKSNDFLRIFGDVIYNNKEKSIKIEPKIIFSSLRKLVRNKEDHLNFLEKKLMFYVILFLIYGELRIYKGKHLINLIQLISSKFYLKKHHLRFNHDKIDLQTLDANKSQVKCIVCLERVREIVFKPCYHMIICERCLYKLKELKCPMCRTDIYDVILVFGDKKAQN